MQVKRCLLRYHATIAMFSLLFLRANSESIPQYAPSAKDFMVSQRFHQSILTVLARSTTAVLARSTTPEFYAPSKCLNGEWTTLTLY